MTKKECGLASYLSFRQKRAWRAFSSLYHSSLSERSRKGERR